MLPEEAALNTQLVDAHIVSHLYRAVNDAAYTSKLSII